MKSWCPVGAVLTSLLDSQRFFAKDHRRIRLDYLSRKQAMTRSPFISVDRALKSPTCTRWRTVDRTCLILFIYLLALLPPSLLHCRMGLLTYLWLIKAANCLKPNLEWCRIFRFLKISADPTNDARSLVLPNPVQTAMVATTGAMLYSVDETTFRRWSENRHARISVNDGTHKSRFEIWTRDCHQALQIISISR